MRIVRRRACRGIPPGVRVIVASGLPAARIPGVGRRARLNCGRVAGVMSRLRKRLKALARVLRRALDTRLASLVGSGDHFLKMSSKQKSPSNSARMMSNDRFGTP